jgi:hypothetical protein
MKIILRRFKRQYELPACDVVRVVPSRDLGAHSPMPGLHMGFVLGRPVVIAEPTDFLGEGSGSVGLTVGSGSAGLAATHQHDQAEQAAAWVVVLQANGDCQRGVFADEVDWKQQG